MRRRDVLRLGGALGSAAALAACGVAPQPQVVERVVEKEVTTVVEVTVPPGAKATKEVTLAHWQHHSTSRAQTVEHFKARFEEDNPGVTIDFQSIPWAEYWGKLASGIAAGAGSAPDVFQIPMGLVEEYVAGGNLVPVDEITIPSQDIEANYLAWTVQRGKREGQYYGLPLDVQTLLIFRNNLLAEEAGIDPASTFEDLTDLYDQAMKMTKKSNGQTDQVGCDTGYYSAWQTILFQQFLQREQDGKQWVDPLTNKLVWPDYPEILELFIWFCQLSGDTDDDAFLTGQNRFALGASAMGLNHPVSRGSLRAQAPDLQYSIVPFPPRLMGSDLYTAGSHWMWVVGKWAPDYDTAWRWVYYCTNRPAQIVWSDIGGDLPSFKDLVDDPRFRKTPNDGVVMDSLKYASPWEWVGWAEWVKEFGDARDRVVVGGETPEQSFNTMVDNLNKVIETHTVKS